MLQVNTTVDDGPKVVNWVFNQLRCRMSFARMVIAHDYPFNIVNHFLRTFLKDLQPEFNMVSRNTLKFDCMRIYEDEKSLLYGMLGKLDCKLSFTSDLWTCKGQDRGFMSLTYHYIDDKWQIRKRLIAFHALPSPHTGVNIAQAIHEKLVTWNLDKKVFSLVLDNASSNDACIKDLLGISQFKRGLPAKGELFHQRCGCHILNLIVGDGLGILTTQIQRVRDTMKYIRGSQQRMEKFKLGASQADASSRKPAWDVPTRWNSTYLMLELALELKEAFIRYASLDNKYAHLPTDHDWDNLQDLVGHLKVGEPVKSELEEYLSEPLDAAIMDDDFDMLSWWKLKAPKFPVLARLTEDVIAVPISTVASESTFSIAGRTLSTIRSSLSDDSLQALLCAQDWLKAPILEREGMVGEVVWTLDEPAKPDDTIYDSAASAT